MRRVGAEPEFAVSLAQSIAQREHLELEGVWTHCAVADDVDNPFSNRQLSIFNHVIEDLNQNEVQIKLPRCKFCSCLKFFLLGSMTWLGVELPLMAFHPFRVGLKIFRLGQR